MTFCIVKAHSLEGKKRTKLSLFKVDIFLYNIIVNNKLIRKHKKASPREQTEHSKTFMKGSKDN